MPPTPRDTTAIASPGPHDALRGAEGARRAIRVFLPLPPRELSPNGRVHWARKAEAVREARVWAKLQFALQTGLLWHAPKWERCHVRIQVYWPDKRRRDLDNLLSGMKPYFDGLSDAGLWVDDSRLTYELLPALVSKERPGVMVTVEEETPCPPPAP